MNYYIIGIVCSVYTLLGGISIYGKYKNKKLHMYVKSIPVLGLAVLLLVNLLLTKDNYTFNILIITGLCAGFIGDFFLSFDTKYFIQGLGSFLIGHVLYAAAFIIYADLAFYPVVTGILLFISLAYLVIFFKTLKSEMALAIRVAIFLYVILLNLMVLSAFNMDRLPGNFPLILIGALLFLVSDAVLAINLFHKKIGPGHVIILSTYYGAQLLITLGVLFR